MLERHDLKSIRPNPWNPNKVDPINQEKLEKSLSVHGQEMPIIVRETKDDNGATYLEVVDGEHRLAAAQALKWKDIQTINLGEITMEEAMRKTVILNTRYGQDDNAKLFALLATDGVFLDTQEILDTLPIDETELNSLFSGADVDFSDLEAELDKATTGNELDMGSGDSQIRPHRILRFKLSNEDADKVEELIERTRAEQGLTDSDAMTNAGDALVYLLKSE